MKHRKLGLLSICLAAIMWGIDGVLLTPRLFNLDPTLVTFLLHALPFSVMSIVFYKEFRLIKKMSASELVYLLLVALCGGILGVIFIVKALFLVQFQHLTIVALLQKLQPVFAIVLAGILLNDRPSIKFFFWAIIAIISGYFLTFGFSLPSMQDEANLIWAAIYSLAAAFCFGSATVFGKKALSHLSFKTALFYRYGFTTLIMLGIVIFNGQLFQISNVTPENWLFFAIIGLTTGGGAILLYYYGLKSVNASVSAICELCFPLTAIICDYLFHAQVLTTTQWVSALIMFIAIIKISRLHSKEGDELKPTKDGHSIDYAKPLMNRSTAFQAKTTSV